VSRSWRWLLIGLAVTLGLALVGGWLVTRVDAPASTAELVAPSAAPSAPPVAVAGPPRAAAASPPLAPPPPPGAAAAAPPLPVEARRGEGQGEGRAEPSSPDDRDEHPRSDSLEAQAHAADAGAIHKLDRDGIQSAIREKLPQIKDCYESWLGMNPQLAGKLVVGFRIVPNDGGTEGVVGEIAIADGGMGHVAMEGCVMNVMSDMRFEAPENGELTVNYPLRFNTK